jgi:hypothetical protein
MCLPQKRRHSSLPHQESTPTFLASSIIFLCVSFSTAMSKLSNLGRRENLGRYVEKHVDQIIMFLVHPYIAQKCKEVIKLGVNNEVVIWESTHICTTYNTLASGGWRSHRKASDVVKARKSEWEINSAYSKRSTDMKDFQKICMPMKNVNIYNRWWSLNMLNCIKDLQISIHVGAFVG